MYSTNLSVITDKNDNFISIFDLKYVAQIYIWIYIYKYK